MLAHKSINGKYQTGMMMDEAPAFGMVRSSSRFIALEPD